MISRRNLLAQGAAFAGGLAFTGTDAEAQLKREDTDPEFAVTNSRIKQSIMGWCFNDQFDSDKMANTLQLAKYCKEIGIVAMEGIPRDAYPAVRKIGLDISLISSHGFAQGPCNPEFREKVAEELLTGIEVAKEVDCKSVITFTGMKFDGMDPDKAAQDCVDTWKEVMPAAEKAGVNIALEHLNSRDDTHPMKGHPGYFGDNVDFCAELIRRVDSPNFKLLFDIYHVSVMNGDVIRRIKQYQEIIGHYHTAGNPGRAELDDTQEINYPPILEAILETGYEDYVAQEFIPTWDDPVLALRNAAQLCDI